VPAFVPQHPIEDERFRPIASGVVLPINLRLQTPSPAPRRNDCAIQKPAIPKGSTGTDGVFVQTSQKGR
jgi:hypothetical protein